MRYVRGVLINAATHSPLACVVHPHPHLVSCTVDTEGFPSISQDGTAVSLSCYARANVSATVVDGSTNYRTLVLVRPDGVVDSSTTVSYGYGGSASNAGSAIHTAVYETTTNRFYMGAAPGYSWTNSYFAAGIGSVVLGTVFSTQITPLAPLTSTR